MTCPNSSRMIACLLLLVTVLTTAKSPGEVVALKRNAGLTVGGSIDSRFNTATVVSTTVNDTAVHGAGDSRYLNSGIATAPDMYYNFYKFDLSSIPAGSRINLAQLRLYRGGGNSSGQGIGQMLTHDWLEGTKNGGYPGAAGGASGAHPTGYNTGPNQNASGGTTQPLQSWGPASNTFFSMGADVGPLQNPNPVSSGAGYHIFNVTAHVQGWISGNLPNYGWAHNQGNWTFNMSEAGSANQPVLFIDYTPGGGSSDTTPPAAVTIQATNDQATSTITIAWTAPGDDGSTGTAGQYDIRYSTSPIDDSNWANATQIVGEPAPMAAGTSQSYTVQGLPFGTFYFAMKTYDELWNVSALSNLVSGEVLDPLPPPRAITDLAITDTRTTGTSHPLTWTAPGAHYDTGTAAAYDLRYSTSMITDANWDSTTQYTYNVPAPAAVGTSQGMTVVYLNMNTTYYFAIKTVNQEGRWSLLSNVASFKTLTAHDMTGPVPVTNLAASNATSNAITLTWNASGDDAIFGTSAYYDIRYSTSPITENVWFWTATKVTGEPTPLAYGTSQSMTVTGLNAGTTYYFAMRAVDEEMNWSGMASVSATTLAAADSTAPAAIGTLVAGNPSSGSVRLTWTASGDDDASGTATTYDIRYSMSEISEDTWASARQVTDELASEVAGTSQTWTVQDLLANTVYYFAIKVIDEAGNSSALSNVVSETTLTTGDLNKPVLTEQDFEYLGAFKLPISANGQTTAYSTGGIAIRRVNGALQLLAEAGLASADSTIYECTFPGWGQTSSTWPQSMVIHGWGKTLYGTPSMMTAYLAGLLFDAATGRFYFSWGPGYNVAGVNYDSLAWAELIDGAPVAHGSWKGNPTTANCQRLRGGSTIIPDWFANIYLGGRRLGLGFGGYYSGWAGCSWGPYLAATMPPTDSTTELDTIPLINHTSAHWATRDADYYYTPATGGMNPVGGVGVWTWCDELFGAGIWIDLPDKHGLVLMPSVGHGHLRYIFAALSMERVELHRQIFDPKDLAAVAQGSMQPWQPKPQDAIVPLAAHASHNGSGGYAGMVSGMALDPETRTLFVLTPGSYNMGGQEMYPLVHGYRIKESFNPCDVDRNGHVDVVDLLYFVDAFGSGAGDPNWDIRCDFNSDGGVDVIDLLTFVENFGL